MNMSSVAGLRSAIAQVGPPLEVDLGIGGDRILHNVQGVTVDEIRDGPVHRHRDYWNLAAYLQQVGLLP